MGVHSTPRVVCEGFRHKRRVNALFDRGFFHNRPESLNVVGGRQRVGVSKVDFILAGARFVVRKLDGDSKVFQMANSVATEIVRSSAGHVIEIARLVDRDGVFLIVVFEEVKLDFGVRVKGETFFCRLGERAAQNVTRVRGCCLSVRSCDVAEHARRRVHLTAPRENLEGCGVRVQQHIRFVNTGESLNRRAIYAESLGEGAFNFGRRERDVLERS
ncbi:unannotated protein [freshwater metagenome]|uniref:Unannotated protein n=1 Tax=freshwater metagenome TaxID=449393 RepID=A0A6J7E2C8_9ZZZZ